MKKIKKIDKMKNILSLLLLLCIFSTLASCSGNTNNKEASDATSKKEESDSPFNIVTIDEKAAWRGLLIERLTEIKGKVLDGEGQNIGAGLVDVDLDGVPELALSYPGGSAGNTFFVLLDIRSGEEVGAFSAGWYGDKPLGELALYLNTETNRYLYVGIANYRGGSGYLTNDIYTVAYDDKLSEYASISLFSEVCEYEEESTLESGPKPAAVKYFIRGEGVLCDEYIYESAVFWQKLVKISESDFVHLAWDETEGENFEEKTEVMADALINTTQVFVKGREIS